MSHNYVFGEEWGAVDTRYSKASHAWYPRTQVPCASKQRCVCTHTLFTLSMPYLPFSRPPVSFGTCVCFTYMHTFVYLQQATQAPLLGATPIAPTGQPQPGQGPMDVDGAAKRAQGVTPAVAAAVPTHSVSKSGTDVSGAPWKRENDKGTITAPRCAHGRRGNYRVSFKKYAVTPDLACAVPPPLTDTTGPRSPQSWELSSDIRYSSSTGAACGWFLVLLPLCQK